MFLPKKAKTKLLLDVSISMLSHHQLNSKGVSRNAKFISLSMLHSFIYAVFVFQIYVYYRETRILYFFQQNMALKP